MKYLRRRAFAHTLYSAAIKSMKDGATAVDAGKTEEAINLYKLALSNLNESRDERSPATRREVEAELAKLTGATPTEAPQLARTEPTDDLEVLYTAIDQRRPIEAELAVAAKKVGGGQ